ncbi:MAG: heavy metal-associated domain-containing protein [Ignavibacteria bacterium]|jgi:hypothetical protein|nr:heavy metal-associated domain-containing protein [Ignavibacteria bacterium]
MKSINIFLVFTIFFSVLLFAQDAKVIESKFKVSGNCDMCKTRIEKALKIDEVKYASWNKTSKFLKVLHDTTISLDSLKHRLANVGHDTDKFKADNDLYKSLPKCCLYRDNSKTH